MKIRKTVWVIGMILAFLAAMLLPFARLWIKLIPVAVFVFCLVMFLKRNRKATETKETAEVIDAEVVDDEETAKKKQRSLKIIVAVCTGLCVLSVVATVLVAIHYRWWAVIPAIFYLASQILLVKAAKKVADVTDEEVEEEGSEKKINWRKVVIGILIGLIVLCVLSIIWVALRWGWWCLIPVIVLCILVGTLLCMFKKLMMFALIPAVLLCIAITLFGVYGIEATVNKGGNGINGDFNISGDLNVGGNVNAAGDVNVDKGNVNVNEGNVNVDKGNVNVNEGDVNVDKGNVNVNEGDVNVDKGNVNVNEGDVNVNKGDVNVNEGDVNVDKGNVNVNEGDVNVNKGDVNVNGDINVGGNINTTVPPTTEPPTTEPPTTVPPATEPPATEPPATEPPATQLNPTISVSTDYMVKGDTVIVILKDAKVSDVVIKYVNPDNGNWVNGGATLKDIGNNQYRLNVEDALWQMSVDLVITLSGDSNYHMVTLEPYFE